MHCRTWLFEAFILGIVAYLRALLVAVVVLIVAAIIMVYINRQGAGPRITRRSTMLLRGPFRHRCYCCETGSSSNGKPWRSCRYTGLL